MKEHETVGRLFTFFGDTYRCTRWQRPYGFWMRLVVLGPSQMRMEGLQREVGSTTCVSERAIGRTYHPVRSFSIPEGQEAYVAEHERPCNCYICEDRPPT